jgi:hypothetical protein
MLGLVTTTSVQGISDTVSNKPARGVYPMEWECSIVPNFLTTMARNGYSASLVAQSVPSNNPSVGLLQYKGMLETVYGWRMIDTHGNSQPSPGAYSVEYFDSTSAGQTAAMNSAAFYEAMGIPANYMAIGTSQSGFWSIAIFHDAMAAWIVG